MTPRDLFEILVREHAEMLTMYLRCAVRDPALVDELFQEAMLIAWKHLERFDRSRPFGPWLRGIAAKLVLARRRQSARAVRICDEDVLAYLDSRHTAFSRLPGDTLDEKLDRLRECLRMLPERYRHVVEMRYQTELPAQQLADRLDLSVETTKKRLQRGRSRLLDCLQRKLSTAISG